jgi:hypothetical protein
MSRGMIIFDLILVFAGGAAFGWSLYRLIGG